MASGLKGFGPMQARLHAIGKTEKVTQAISIRGVAYAKATVHRRTSNLARTIRVGTNTPTQASIVAGGRLKVGYAGAEEQGRRAVTIRPKPGRRTKSGRPTMLAWGGNRRLSGSLRSGAKPTNFAREVHQPARAGHPYLRPGLQRAANDVGIQTIVQLWNSAA